MKAHSLTSFTQIDAHFASGGDEDSLPTDSEPTDLDAFLAWQQQQQQMSSNSKPGKRGPPAWLQTAADAYLTVLAAEYAHAIDRANEQLDSQAALWASYWDAFAAHPSASVFASAPASDSASHDRPRHLVSASPFRLAQTAVRAHRRSAGVLRAQLVEAARRFERADAIDAQALLVAQTAAARASAAAEVNASDAVAAAAGASVPSSSDEGAPLIDPSAMAAVLPEVERAIQSAAQHAHATVQL